MTWDQEEWADGPAWWTAMAMNAIEDGRMPPWQPAPDCRSIKHDRTLRAEERAVLEVWQAEGFALGDEPSATEMPTTAPSTTPFSSEP